MTPVPRVYLPVLLTAPGPSGSAGPSRLCRGCSRPSRRPPGPAAPSFTTPLRRRRNGRSPTSIRTYSASWRTRWSGGSFPEVGLGVAAGRSACGPGRREGQISWQKPEARRLGQQFKLKPIGIYFNRSCRHAGRGVVTLPLHLAACELLDAGAAEQRGHRGCGHPGALRDG
jgi:hypothetical protein